MDPATLNLTTEVLGYGKFCFVRLDAADAVLIRSIESIGANFENMHLVDGHPVEAAKQRGRLQYLRSASSVAEEHEIADTGLSFANVLIRLEARTLEPLNAYEQALRPLIEQRGGEVHTRLGVSKQRSYTSHAMTQFAYAHALAPCNGDKHPIGVVTPQSKTQEWWAMDWMRRESYFLPRYGPDGNMLAKGHALASAAGISHINRRLYHHPEGYGLDTGYDFVGYFEFAAADAPVFRAVMSALRDPRQNPEWEFVREGPEWWGQRVCSAGQLWAAI